MSATISQEQRKTLLTKALQGERPVHPSFAPGLSPDLFEADFTQCDDLLLSSRSCVLSLFEVCSSPALACLQSQRCVRLACPYLGGHHHRFRVGACLLTDDGQYITGCNVENASYGAGICAGVSPDPPSSSDCNAPPHRLTDHFDNRAHRNDQSCCMSWRCANRSLQKARLNNKTPCDLIHAEPRQQALRCGSCVEVSENAALLKRGLLTPVPSCLLSIKLTSGTHTATWTSRARLAASAVNSSESSALYRSVV